MKPSTGYPTTDTALILKTAFFLAIVPGSITFLIPYLLLSAMGENFMDYPDRLHYFGFMPIFTGAAVCLKCFMDFISKGKGTPAPIDPPKVLVVDGLYRKVRNPMYIGILLILLGEAFLFSSPILYLYSLMMYCIYHLLVIGYEEPILLSSFGEAYEKYCASVPRWLIRIK